MIWTIIIGGIAGWLAGEIMSGDGYGIILDIIIGIIGGWIGGMVLGWIGITAAGLIGNLIVAIIGSIILIWLVRLITGD